MKTIILIISILGFINLISCTQKKDVSKLLDNSETRSAIFETISSDHDLMALFMESMKSNEQAMQMMQGDYMMMGHMMKGNGMHMMMNDSMMMHTMMGDMMKSEKVMGNMIQMMNNEGMMSNECMQAMMKSMNDMGTRIKGNGMMIHNEDNK